LFFFCKINILNQQMLGRELCGLVFGFLQPTDYYRYCRLVCWAWRDTRVHWSVIRVEGRDGERVFQMAFACHVLRLKYKFADCSSVSRFSNLQSLNLTHVPLYDDVINSIAGLHQLHTLSIVNHTKRIGLTDDRLATLAGIESLTNLDLAFCHNVTAIGRAHLSRLVNLRKLNLQDHNLIDSDADTLVSLPCLEELHLGQCSQFTDTGVVALSAIRTLHVLSWGQDADYPIGQRAFLTLSALANLETLRLIHCPQISNAGLQFVRLLPHLREFELGTGTRITAAGLCRLKFPQGLYSITLDYGISDELIWRLPRSVEVLRLLNTHTDEISIVGISHTCCLHLSELDLHSVEHEWIEIMSSRLHNLRTLRLGHCDELTDCDFELLARLTTLTTLRVHRILQVTDRGVGHLTRLHGLQELNMSNCLSMTNESCEHLRLLHDLRRLTIMLFETLTDDGLMILEGLCRLEFLHVFRTRVTSSALATFGRKKHVKIVTR